MTGDCDVLVVGLGPVGAALSALLVRRGVRVIAIDRDTDVYPLPRAAHFDHEIMRLFQQLGIADDVLEHSRAAPAYEFRSAKGEILLRFELGSTSPSGWPASFMFHQPAVEHALRAKLAANADMRLGWRFETFAPLEDGLSVTLSGSGGRETLETRYLVGCDGASSAVRAACGIGLTDFAFDEPWLVIDAIVGEGAVLPDVNLQICDPARPTTCVLMGPGRHRWEFMLKPHETPDAMLEDGTIAKLLEPWGCRDAIIIDRKAVYRFHGLIAEQWRRGRVLLAGDAAHQMPPFAGQGMCSGLRDAANLAWKLAAVLHGEANEAVLDTYQTEREPHVRAILESSMAMGRVVCTLDAGMAQARDAGMLAERAAGRAPVAPASPALGRGLTTCEAPAGNLFVQPWGERNEEVVRFDDAMPDGAWIVTRKKPNSEGAMPKGITLAWTGEPHLAPFAAQLESWLDRHGAEAVLVRPDRYIFGVGDAQDLAAKFRAGLSRSSFA